MLQPILEVDYDGASVKSHNFCHFLRRTGLKTHATQHTSKLNSQFWTPNLTKDSSVCVQLFVYKLRVSPLSFVWLIIREPWQEDRFLSALPPHLFPFLTVIVSLSLSLPLSPHYLPLSLSSPICVSHINEWEDLCFYCNGWFGLNMALIFVVLLSVLICVFFKSVYDAVVRSLLLSLTPKAHRLHSCYCSVINCPHWHVCHVIKCILQLFFKANLNLHV